MTGQKNRFSTSEKLWNLDDKQLKTPQHDAMVLWLMDENNVKPLLFNFLRGEDDNYGWFKKTFKQGDVVENNVKISSETPIMSSNTFIAGYADLIVEWNYATLKKHIYCPISSKWYYKTYGIEKTFQLQKVIREYLKDEEYDMKKYLSSANYDGSMKIYLDGDGNEIDFDTYYELDYSERDENGYSSNYYEKYATKVAPVKDFMCNVLEDYPCSRGDLYLWLEQEKYYWKYFKTFGYGDRGYSFLIEVKPYIDSFGAVLRQIKSYKQFTNYDRYCLFTLDNGFDAQFKSQGIIVLHPPEDVTIEDMMELYL